MHPQANSKQSRRHLLTSKPIVIATVVVVALTIISVWLLGLGQHRSIFKNALFSTSILSVVFFLFLTIGLYKGIKLKDDIGKITDKFTMNKMHSLTPELEWPSEILPLGEGLMEFLGSIIAWFFFTVVLLLFFWLFSAIIWGTILVFAAMLYWIFFRALRLVFKNGYQCKNNFVKSAFYAFLYTSLYNFWMYGIILASHYLIQ